MKVLVFRHVPFEGLGRIADVPEAHSIDIDYADLHKGSGAPDPAQYAGLIFMGGPMSANDDLAYLREETQCIAQAVQRQQSVLGICLGAQLVAKALGARVYRNPVKEIGWFDVQFSPEAAEDALLACAAPVETVFHWHGETFDLPPGAVRLGSSDACLNQAFRVGRAVYGLQFHLEVTPEMIAAWCLEDANCGDVRELDHALDPSHNSVRLKELSDGVFGAWCKLLR